VPGVAPITAFVGLNGAGKTLGMMELVVLPAWRQGRPVVSNLALDPERVGFSPDLFVPLQSWRQIPRLGVVHDADGVPDRSLSVTRGRGCALALDEINALFPARQFGAMPPELVRVLSQLRKQDVTVAWTSPAWASGDVELRRVTRQVVLCKGRFADPWVREDRKGWLPPIKRDPETGRRVLANASWRPNRLFAFKAYAAEDFEEFSLDRAAKIAPLWAMRYWRQRHLAHRAYDTAGQVSLLDHLDFTGVCIHCDGTRRRHQCKCDIGAPADAEGSRGDVAAVPTRPDPSLTERSPGRRRSPLTAVR
jgi:hypothetical protein